MCLWNKCAYYDLCPYTFVHFCIPFTVLKINVKQTNKKQKKQNIPQTHIRTHTYTHTRAHARTCTHTHTHSHIHINARAHAHTQKRSHSQTHTHTINYIPFY